ncbi:sugar-phosphatase [Alkalibacterium iburiense]|uniref:Sugar-phosphatase n=1 Tax=Alkalibacterium iburiense TaxID=290589 RepID=A0ABN0XG90_9LACT
MTIKLIAIDMDGTLLNNEKRVTRENKEALWAAHEAGIQIVLCTGRPTPGVIDYLEELGLDKADDYIITYNGALVQNIHTRSVLVDYTMTYEDYMEIEQAVSKAGAHFHAIHDNKLFTPNKDISPYSVRESFLSNVPISYRTPEEMDASAHFNKMMMIDDPAVLDAAIPRLPEELWEKYTILRSEPFFLEFLNKQASKGNAVKALAEQLGVAREEVMTIGDGANDTDMIAYAGLGVAMENAVDEVKDAADVITRSNADDGVAHAIYTYALKG